MHLLVTVAVVIVAARGLGRVAVALGQPAVVGEMIAGILLGPSVLGAASPGVALWLFPPTALPTLDRIAQGAIALFMFSVGMDLDFAAVGTSRRQIAGITAAAVAIPFALGWVMARWYYPEFAGSGVRFLPFGLFVALALAVTAFPVLARLLRDRRLEQTPLGLRALAVAAVTDVVAWLLLAFVVALGSRRVSDAALPLIAIVAMPVVAWRGVRPLLARVWASTPRTDGWAAGLALCAAGAGSVIGQASGVHAVFGAFITGLAAPRDTGLRTALDRSLFRWAGWLLPLYFAITGLRTQVGLLTTRTDWAMCAATVVVATIGKVGGTAIGARLMGLPRRAAIQLGVLMNTRGLMELVVLNVGLELRLISPRLFAMLVLMTFVTTGVTGPLLSVVSRPHRPE